jgi:hypothetical protein
MVSVMLQGLQLMSTLNVPVYITETGIADAAGDRRPLWLQTYIPEVTHPSGLEFGELACHKVEACCPDSMGPRQRR